MLFHSRLTGILALISNPFSPSFVMFPEHRCRSCDVDVVTGMDSARSVDLCFVSSCGFLLSPFVIKRTFLDEGGGYTYLWI